MCSVRLSFWFRTRSRGACADGAGRARQLSTSWNGSTDEAGILRAQASDSLIAFETRYWSRQNSQVRRVRRKDGCGDFAPVARSAPWCASPTVLEPLPVCVPVSKAGTQGGLVVRWLAFSRTYRGSGHVQNGCWTAFVGEILASGGSTPRPGGSMPGSRRPREKREQAPAAAPEITSFFEDSIARASRIGLIIGLGLRCT
jgi:hypothetical protein